MIRSFLRAGLLYEDALHHNCVFMGRDTEGAPRFANQQGTYDLNGAGFKGDVPGSDKSIGFRLPSRSDLDWVLVFEAPINRIGAKSIPPPFPPAAKTAVHSFAPPFPISPAALGSDGSPI